MLVSVILSTWVIMASAKADTFTPIVGTRGHIIDEYNRLHPSVLSYGPLLYKTKKSRRIDGDTSEDYHKQYYDYIGSAALRRSANSHDYSLDPDDLKSAPYQNLPHEYINDPASVDATNTYVVEATVEAIDEDEYYDRKESKETEDHDRDDKAEESYEDYSEKQRQNDSEVSKSKSREYLFETIDLTPSIRDEESGDDPQVKRKRKSGKKYEEKEKPFVPSKPAPIFIEDYPKPVYKVSSHPLSSPFGVAVDFAGKITDNPLYKENYSDSSSSNYDIIYESVKDDDHVGVFQREIKPDKEVSSYDPAQDSLKANIPTVTTSSKPNFLSSQPIKTYYKELPETLKKQYTRTISSKPLPPSPSSSPSTGTIRGFPRQPPPYHYYHDPLMTRVGFVMSKMMGGHYGDRVLDVFDFLPLLGLALGTGLLLAGLFPNGLASLGINNGNLVISARKNDDIEESAFTNVLDQIESGMLMVSAMRHDSGCTQKLACKLGDLAKNNLGQNDLVVKAFRMILPSSMDDFSSSFEKVLREEDRSSCQQECYRCIKL